MITRHVYKLLTHTSDGELWSYVPGAQSVRYRPDKAATGCEGTPLLAFDTPANVLLFLYTERPARSALQLWRCSAENPIPVTHLLEPACAEPLHIAEFWRLWRDNHHVMHPQYVPREGSVMRAPTGTVACHSIVPEDMLATISQKGTIITEIKALGLVMPDLLRSHS